MHMKSAWITGANGLIGNYLVQSAPKFALHWQVRPLTRRDFDLLDFATVRREFERDQPQLIIHCAAMAVVGEAQRNPELARRVNVAVTQFLAELAAEIPFVFFSTDVVFDGRKGNYIETDPPNPLHVYGETKAEAEAMVLKNSRHLIVRTSLNAGKSISGIRGFDEQLRRALQSGQGTTLFKDEYRSPIPAEETARAVWDLVGKNCTGIYHVAGAEKLSRLEIGELLIRHWPEVTAEIRSARIKSGLAKDFPGPTRALDTSLDISKAQNRLSTPLPKFSAWTGAHLTGAF
jgi:dTDP-4-dehydrorhamnose reductase